MDRRWDPFTALATVDREFDQLVRRAWGPTASRARTTTGYVPAVEMRTDGTDVVIRLELPGVDVHSDVTIEVDRGRLSISGERRETASDDGAGVIVRELRYGSFRRDFALPDGFDASQIEATYDAGMLEVRVHNVVRPQPEPQRVPIQSGRPAVEAATVEVEAGAESGA